MTKALKEYIRIINSIPDLSEKEKKLKILEEETLFLDIPEMLYYDYESEDKDLIDDKIEVLTALKEGKQPFEIPKFYDILELLPWGVSVIEKDGTVTNLSEDY